jgi:hypothetical protein
VGEGMRFIIDSDYRRFNAIEYIQQQNIKRPLQVDIKPYKKNRSNSQNNLYHMWKKAIADETGETEEELHKKLKVEFLGTVESVCAGVTLIEPISTRTLDTVAFSQFLNKIEGLGHFLNIKLPMPDDYKFAMMYD